MIPNFCEAEGTDAAAALKLSYDVLEEGDFQSARGLAQSVLIAARTSADRLLEGRALSCLAHCDRAAGRLQRASDTSRKAAQLFEHLGDVEGEAAALTTLAHVSMLLGRNDDAIEAALLCVRLCEPHAVLQPPAVFAHNCLGIAFGWSGSFDSAQRALERAIHTAEHCVPRLSTYEPRVNLALVEATRLVDERYETGRMPQPDRLGRLVLDFKQVQHSGDGITIAPALTPVEGAVPLVLEGLAACWRGDVTAAQAHFDAAMRSLKGTATWLDALVHWLSAEVSWLMQDWKATERALRALGERATAVQHEHLVCIAHLLLAQVCEIQSKHSEARREHRLLRGRERRLAARGLASREAGVGWRLDARQSEHHLQQALIASKKFEQWSLEDALTGIANRRCFEQTLSQRLAAAAASGASLTLAMIDVDRFKSINDTHSHQIGDAVLKALASLLCEGIRDNDMAARLAGDEFVLILDDADLALAQDICQRIQKVVAAYDWDAIAPGLQPTISIGLATSTSDDDVDGLLRRSDRSMYWVKPDWVPTNL